MEAVYYAARANLRRLLRSHPDWTRPHARPAQQVCRSVGLINGKSVCFVRLSMMSRSCRDSRGRLIIPNLDLINRWWIGCWRSGMIPPKAWVVPLVPKLSSISLPRDKSLKERGLRLPKSTRTIHRLLRENERIASRPPHLTEPRERPEPMEHWQLDFKDASTVPADPHGKRQHVVETLNLIDQGTSILVDHHVRPDFTAETALRGCRTDVCGTGITNLHHPGP